LISCSLNLGFARTVLHIGGHRIPYPGIKHVVAAIQL
jgi:hypothetical protein